MPAVCKKCGLPQDLCVCETLAKEKDKITVHEEQMRFKKAMTFVEGISKDIDSRQLLRDLKNKLACGGTIKDGILELQGKHKHRIKQFLIQHGFSEEQIEVR